MVRSESADEEVVIDKYDDLEDDDFSPQSRWATQTSSGMPNRPDSRTASSLSPTSGDPDRRLRRQIANCNERRRMQSINAGFQSLRTLLPKKEGEKLSKAAILQQTADLIHQLQSEREQYMNLEREGAGGKKAKMECCDFADMDQRAIIDKLQMALERERTNRIYLEQQLSQMRDQLLFQNSSLSPNSPTVIASSNSSQGTIPTIPVSPANTLSMEQSPLIPHESNLIRPTPLPPISIDVSSRVGSSVPLSCSPLSSLNIPLTSSLAISSAPSAFTTSSLSAHRSLQTILDAIRHLEGGSLVVHSPPPSSQAPLVR